MAGGLPRRPRVRRWWRRSRSVCGRRGAGSGAPTPSRIALPRLIATTATMQRGAARRRGIQKRFATDEVCVFAMEGSPRSLRTPSATLVATLALSASRGGVRGDFSITVTSASEATVSATPGSEKLSISQKGSTVVNACSPRSSTASSGLHDRVLIRVNRPTGAHESMERFGVAAACRRRALWPRLANATPRGCPNRAPRCFVSDSMCAGDAVPAHP